MNELTQCCGGDFLYLACEDDNLDCEGYHEFEICATCGKQLNDNPNNCKRPDGWEE
jgi:hypothetical protein